MQQILESVLDQCKLLAALLTHTCVAAVAGCPEFVYAVYAGHSLKDNCLCMRLDHHLGKQELSMYVCR